MTDIAETLIHELGQQAVLTGPEISEKYFVDYTGDKPCMPLAVIRPASTEEVSRILKLCSQMDQKVVVQGGLSGLAGGATPQHNEIAISLERMSGIETIDPTSMTLTALAGTPLQAIQEAAEDAGLLFPLDLGARGSCNVGGNIATNAGGNQVIRFGMMRNLVLGLEAVLADGTVLTSMNTMLKNNAGYDLKQLFIGTEGTLGVITRAVLRLYPKLTSRSTALCALNDFPSAIKLLNQARIGLGSSLSTFEAMWASYYDYVLDHIKALRSPFDERYPLYVLVESEGTDTERDQQLFEATLNEALDTGIIKDAVVAQSQKDTRLFWNIRDGIGEVTQYLIPYATFDISLPIGEMSGFLDRVHESLTAKFTNATKLVFGHIGDNNLHLVVTTGTSEDVKKIFDLIYRLTGAHKGSVSAEHGIGTQKLDYLHYSRSAEEIEVMQRLKNTLDPGGILNPGRVLP